MKIISQMLEIFMMKFGKFFFFMSARRDEDALCKNQKITYEDIRAWTTKPENGLPDIYWVDAGFIQKLKPER